jgi:hypothetical protein
MLDVMEELNDRKYESVLDAHNSHAISIETYQMSIEQAIYLYDSNPALTDAQGKAATQVKDETWEIPNLLGNILFGPPLTQFVAIPQEGAPARPQTPTILDTPADWLIIDQDELFERSIPKEGPITQESNEVVPIFRTTGGRTLDSIRGSL